MGKALGNVGLLGLLGLLVPGSPLLEEVSMTSSRHLPFARGCPFVLFHVPLASAGNALLSLSGISYKKINTKQSQKKTKKKITKKSPLFFPSPPLFFKKTYLLLAILLIFYYFLGSGLCSVGCIPTRVHCRSTCRCI